MSDCNMEDWLIMTATTQSGGKKELTKNV